MGKASVRALIVLVFFGCGDDAQRAADVADTDPGDTAIDTADTAPPDTAPSCQAALTEVDRGFVEVVARGDCADWSVAIRDGAVAGCALSAEVFFPRGVERMALEGFQVPATAVLILQDTKLHPIAVWTLGTCEPDASCLGFIGDDETRAERQDCLPADTTTGTVSLCGEQWVADKQPTPGAENDCTCAVDCQKAAGVCQTGRCTDGACAFDPRDEGGGCNDFNLCTQNDRCVAGTCTGESLACAPPAGPCAEPGVCEPRTGACVYVDTCGENASCTANGCECTPGYAGDGIAGCANVDECAAGSAQCDPLARCVDQVGGYLCVCPLGYAGDGHTCTPTNCACPWEPADTCGAAFNRLRVRVTDLWGQPVEGARLVLTDVPSAQAIRAETVAGWEIDEPLCGERDFGLAVEALDHHPFAGTINWLGNDITIQSTPSRDHAWAITWDAAGPIVWVGLAHKWFAASGRPARHGNRIELLMDGEEAWGAVFDELRFAQRLVTAASWWWESDVELVRPPGHAAMSAADRWHNTALGALEDLVGVEKKVLIGQFVSQDGILSGQTVDDELLEKAESPGDDFEYMGMANTVRGTFMVTPQPIDYGARVVRAHPGEDTASLVDEAPADPFWPPVEVGTDELPLGLGIFDLPIASWHQKFWTIDQRVAFIGGMNAKKTDWDTSQHIVFDERREDFDADYGDRQAVIAKEEEPDFGPRKDYIMRMEGPMVQDAVDVFNRRWQHQLDQGVEYADRASPIAVDPTTASYPDGLQAQVVATMPRPFDENAILETLARALTQAKRFIYIEDQYFRAPIIYDIIVQRMTEEPEMEVMVFTNSVSEWTDPGCYQTAIAYERFKTLFPDRFRLYRLRAFDYVRTDCTFCWDETEAHFKDMDLHSKIVIIDDEYLEVGSCNSNNRGLLYEGELAVAVHDRGFVSAQRRRIFENVLGPGYDGGMPFSDIFAAFDERAAANRRAYDLWDDEGMDLDLDGEPVRGDMIPSGLVYPMSFDVPDECLIEGVGEDVT